MGGVPTYNEAMTCRVIKRFEARPPFEPNLLRVFRPGEVLENVDYCSGEMAIFQLADHADQAMYQLPIKKFKGCIKVITF
jgi:hypothetical protein